jgi:dihydrofolate reductase
MGSPIIMGRKTYESIGRLLPGRRNLIVTRSSDYRVMGGEIYHSVEAAIQSCETIPMAITNSNPVEPAKVFIIGGAEIFKHSWNLIHEIYRTLILHNFEADTFFPEIKTGEFENVWNECHKQDEKNAYDYCFEKWVRKN